MRTGARWFKLRRMPLQMEDILIYGALVSFAITTALYLATVGTFFNLEAIQQGRMEPYAGLENDLVLMLHEFFVVQFFFWLTLWMVKWSLMFMAVPMRVLWGLQMSLVEKISVGVVFAVGLITMVTAIIRSVTLESSSTSGQVSTTWLIMWAAIEGAIAMIVGCLPSFAVFIHGRVAASRAQYASGSNKNPAGPRTKSRGTTGSNRLWQYHDASSDKSLVGGGIVVTQSWRQSWHKTTGGKADRVEGLETDHELEIVGGNNGNGK
ncbi:uncharacterized protein Triagg1_5612 [Trichoderma aggressivum f. europaeum]|uniref:Rhodopsin domain-containing protein n=1 Tax=Trichoderma aggressivum f. europaeum TaxID=173218 RepID=A0AAE1IE04_9HYPO|nr:hypothetical protein Triagg1_5612 [Trichoderma aggressivum f. europaeum]